MLEMVQCLVDGFMIFIDINDDMLFSWHSKKVRNGMIK